MMGLVSGNRLNRFWKKGVKPIKDAIGVLTALSTVDKETLVGAINELADGKLDVAKVIASVNVTEPGYAMDAKTASETFAELYSNMHKLDWENSVDIAKEQLYAVPKSGIVFLSLYHNNGNYAIFYIGGAAVAREVANASTYGTYMNESYPVSEGDTARLTTDTNGNCEIYLLKFVPYA